jgi:ATP-dependent metalloprotease
VNLAILGAVKNDRSEATSDDFEAAHDRLAMGVGRKNSSFSDREKRVVSYHEGGHALTALLTDGAQPLHKVTILPRGSSLGFVYQTLHSFPHPYERLKPCRRKTT